MNWYCVGCKAAGGDCGPYLEVSALFEKIQSFHRDHPGWGTTPPEPTIQQLATQAFEDSDLSLKQAVSQANFYISKRDGVRESKKNKIKLSEDFTFSDAAYELMIQNEFRTLEDTDKILFYKDGIYHENGELQIKMLCEDWIKECTRDIVNEITATIKRKTPILRAMFDNDDFEICLLNCVVNTATGKITPHSHTNMFRSQLPVDYDPKARCPKFVRFLHTCLPHPDDYIDQLEAFASGLLKNRPKLEAMFFETGKGDNGKSTFINIINWFYGPENISTVSIHELLYNKFAKARLENKRVNTFPDIESDALDNFGILKALVSGDAVDAEFKYQNPYTFVCHAKLFFSANELPEIKEKTFATFKRIRLTKWSQSFVKVPVFEMEKEKMQVKYPEYTIHEIADELSINGVHLMDRQFVNSILDDESEKSGILNLLLIVARNIVKRDGFFNDYSHTQLNELWSENSTMIEAFVKDCLVRDHTSWVDKSKVYQVYHAYCRQYGKPPKPDNVFHPVLQSLFNIESSQKRVKGGKIRIYEGLRWNRDELIVSKMIVGTGGTGVSDNHCGEKIQNSITIERFTKKPVSVGTFSSSMVNLGESSVRLVESNPSDFSGYDSPKKDGLADE